MPIRDQISDLIIRIRDAQMLVKTKVSTPGSKMRANVLEILKNEGYIRGYSSVEHSSGRREIEVELKYFDGEPVIRDIHRVSKPGHRVYVSVRNLPRVKSDFGVSVLLTPKGIMADHDARDANVGGEVLFTVLADAAPAGSATGEPDLLASARARMTEHRKQLALLGGGLSAPADVARMIGLPLHAVDERRQSGRLLAVKLAGDWAYPAFQFNDKFPADDLKRVLELVDDPGGWVALDFLLTPDAALGGKTPAETRLLGPEAAARVVRLARAERSDGFS